MEQRSLHSFNKPLFQSLLFLFGLSIGHGALAQEQISWTTVASSQRGNNYQQFTYICPPIDVVPTFAGWGTDVYSDDSYICPAAVHAGVLTAAGGSVTIEIRPGQSEYVGSSRHGTTTNDYGSWPGSFIVIQPNATPTPAPTAAPTPAPTAAPPPAPPTTPVPAPSSPIALLGAAGFPNERTSNDPPQNAIDGNPETFTWTTEHLNSSRPSYLAVDFAAASVSRIRLWKTNEDGGGQYIKNLTIEYTTDPGPLASRSWRRVEGLANGFNGTELLRTIAVNADGTVLGETHNSPAGDGWGSLTFTPVTATGLRIGFSNPQSFGSCSGTHAPSDCNYYRVGEFQVYSAGSQ